VFWNSVSEEKDKEMQLAMVTTKIALSIMMLCCEENG